MRQSVSRQSVRVNLTKLSGKRGGSGREIEREIERVVVVDGVGHARAATHRASLPASKLGGGWRSMLPRWATGRGTD